MTKMFYIECVSNNGIIMLWKYKIHRCYCQDLIKKASSVSVSISAISHVIFIFRYWWISPFYKWWFHANIFFALFFIIYDVITLYLPSSEGSASGKWNGDISTLSLILFSITLEGWAGSRLPLHSQWAINAIEP